MNSMIVIVQKRSLKTLNRPSLVVSEPDVGFEIGVVAGQRGAVSFTHGPFAKSGRKKKSCAGPFAVCQPDPQGVVLRENF